MTLYYVLIIGFTFLFGCVFGIEFKERFMKGDDK